MAQHTTHTVDTKKDKKVTKPNTPAETITKKADVAPVTVEAGDEFRNGSEQLSRDVSEGGEEAEAAQNLQRAEQNLRGSEVNPPATAPANELDAEATEANESKKKKNERSQAV
jgi:hypothetical protein